MVVVVVVVVWPPAIWVVREGVMAGCFVDSATRCGLVAGITSAITNEHSFEA